MIDSINEITSKAINITYKNIPQGWIYSGSHSI